MSNKPTPKISDIKGTDDIEVWVNKGDKTYKATIKAGILIPNIGDEGIGTTPPPEGSYTTVTSKDITSVVNEGGIEVAQVIPAGTSLEEFIELFVAPYLTSAFTAFSITNDSGVKVVEVGRTITVSQATYSTANDTEGNPPDNIVINGVGFDPSTIITVSPHAADLAPFTVAKTTNTTESWTIVGENLEGDVLNSTDTVTWRYSHEFGANSTTIIDDASAQLVIDALQQPALTSNKNRIVNCTADNDNPANFTYICYAAKFGDLNNVLLDGVSPVLGAFTKLGDFNYTNSYGHTESYRVYKTGATGAFNATQSLTIS